jgi:choline-sulfatase
LKKRISPLRAPGSVLPGALFFGLCGVLASPWSPAFAAGPPVAPALPDILLVTLDTTRADALGAYGGAARTPSLDGLAARGVRFEEALSAVPLTLPAHATLFTGLDPVEHGLRDNGAGRLAAGIPTLAEALRARGYATAGVIASRVLDRRFGLDRGFDRYEETMAAERLGEYGYPERPAAQVVDAALAWARTADPARPQFLWVHFYDPHAPYLPPAGAPPGTPQDERSRYLAEVEIVDRELARLLGSLSSGPRAAQPRLVAAVGDHGESLGEHGEKEHGLLLTRAVLRVPLLLAGPGVPAGQTIRGPVATGRLAATLLDLVDRSGPAGGTAASSIPERKKDSPRGVAGAPLSLRGGNADSAPVYHETLFPFSAFGWAPLYAITEGPLRFVLGPRPQLFDLRNDPNGLESDLGAGEGAARKLRKELKSLLDRKPFFPPSRVEPDAELAAALQSLGYLSGQSAQDPSARSAAAQRIDPSEGLVLQERFMNAKRQLAADDVAGALSVYERLTAESPGSVPFWMERAAAERRLGKFPEAIASLERARRLNPELDFLDLRLGETFLAAGRRPEAEAALRRALARNPRFAQAALALGELLGTSGRLADEERVVRDAVEAGTSSVFLLTRLAQIEVGRGDLAGADLHLAEATRLIPEFATAWKLWAEVARRQGRAEAAAERAARAAALGRPRG